MRHRSVLAGDRVSALLAPMLVLLLPLAASAQPVTATAPTRLTLVTRQQAIDLALQRNQSLRAQRLNVDQSRAGEVTAGLKPNPVFTSSNQDFPIFTPAQITLSNAANVQTFTQSVSYLLERGDKRERRIQAARDTTEVTTRGVDDAERQLRFQVGQAFINVLLAKANLALAEDDLKDFTQVVDLNRERLARGDIAEGDYLKVTLQKLQFEQDLSAAQVALVQGKAALRQLLGYEVVAEDFDVAGDLAHRPVTVTIETLQREAAGARPDLLGARASTKLAGSTLDLARANRVRDVTLEAEYDRNGPVNGVGIGVSFDIPIHNRNQGEIARSEAAVRQARESESAALVGVLTDVVNAHAALQTNEKLVVLYEGGYLEQARQSREISRYAYTKGAASLLDLLDAERTYRATQLAYRQALAAYMTSVEQINFVVGKQVIP
jgi:cobalt-zinc-cadmium efflux system outer membrane protein